MCPVRPPPAPALQVPAGLGGRQHPYKLRGDSGLAAHTRQLPFRARRAGAPSIPAAHAWRLLTRSWSVSVEGEVAKPRRFDIDDLLKLAPLEERIYRLRCVVEGWSMVIPWLGYSLSALLKQVKPTSKAKYVEFVTVKQNKTMPGLRSRVLEWSYVEGLRLDKAMHPLTMLVFGVYGKALPNQNGAPLRLAVPWKYGFKSAKSLVTIRLLEKQPATAWMKSAPTSTVSMPM